LPLAPDEQAGFIMTLLRLYTFRPALATDAPATIVRPLAQPKPKSVTPAPVATPITPLTLVQAIETVPVPAPVKSAEVPMSAQTEAHDWHAILAALNLGGMARELAQHCALRRVDGSNVFLCLSPTHRHLQMKPAQDKLQQSLSEYFSRPIQLAIELEETIGDTPAAVAQQRKVERQDRAVAAVEQDEFVRGVIDMFDATLIESSIKPV